MISFLFSNKNIFLKVSILSLLLIAGNSLQESSFGSAKHIFSFVFIFYLLTNLISKKYLYNLYATLLYFMVFSLYPRVLYDDSFLFVSYFSGYYKLVVIVIFLISIGKINHNNKFVILLCFIQILSIFIGLLLYGNFKYFLNDFMYVFIIYSPLILLLSNKIKHIDVDIKQLLNFLHAYSISYVIYNLYILVFYEVQIGSTGSLFLSFGPTNLLVFLSLIYFSSKSVGFLRIITIIFLILFTPIKILSINSQEIIVLLLLGSSYFFFNRKYIYKIAVSVMFIVVLFSISNYSFKTGNFWLDLKLNQVFSLVETNKNSEISNSSYIRLLEFELLKNQVLQSPSVLFGKGLGATLKNSNNLLFKANLHEATFPEEEIKSGEIHGLHESIYKYLLRYGLIGFIGILGVYKYFFSFYEMFKKRKDKMFFISIVFLSFYFYGWSYKFQFILNFILAFLIIEVKRKLKIKNEYTSN